MLNLLLRKKNRNSSIDSIELINREIGSSNQELDSLQKLSLNLESKVSFQASSRSSFGLGDENPAEVLDEFEGKVSAKFYSSEEEVKDNPRMDDFLSMGSQQLYGNETPLAVRCTVYEDNSKYFGEHNSRN